MPEPNPALAEALSRLNTAERTVQELRDALLKKFEPAEVEQALEWLLAKRLLSEERAVEALVRPRTQGRRAEGDTRLRQRLEARGADETAVEAALANAPTESERMQEALTAKFRTPNPADRAKAGRFLISRGFDEDAIETALDRFFAEG